MGSDSPDSLYGARPGDTVRLTGLTGLAPQRLRLAEFGLRAGAVITVLGRTAGDGRMVAVGTGRIAVDRSTARLMRVEPAS